MIPHDLIRREPGYYEALDEAVRGMRLLVEAMIAACFDQDLKDDPVVKLIGTLKGRIAVSHDGEGCLVLYDAADPSATSERAYKIDYLGWAIAYRDPTMATIQVLADLANAWPRRNA